MLELDLEGVNAKIRRADSGLNSLQSELDEFCEKERERYIHELRRGSVVVLGSNPHEQLVDYSIRVGEIVYNLRSALDHLVWQLVWSNREIPTTRNEFPIFSSEDKYRKAARRKLEGMAPRHAALIERAQPYHKDSAVGRHLWMLQMISNIDKHRYVNVISMYSIADAYLKDDGVPSDLTYGLTSGKGLLFLMRGTEYEQHVEIDVKTDVCFRDRELMLASPGYGSELEKAGNHSPPVTSALSSSRMAVQEVIRRVTEETEE